MRSSIAFSSILSLILLTSVGEGVTYGGQPPLYRLESRRTPGSIDQVSMAVEVEGTVDVGPDSRRREKMKVVANLDYWEKTMAPGGADAKVVRSLRQYQRAAGAIQVGDYSLRPELRPSRRLIRVDLAGPRVTLFSPQGPLTRDELDLVDLVGNSLVLDRLLPPRAVRVGDRWAPSGDTVAALLGLEEVTSVEVQSTLAGLDDGSARLEMQGRVQGRQTGATADVQLRAKVWFDLATGRVTWLGLVVQERRGAGLVDRPFDALARVQMKVTPGAASDAFSEEELAGMSLETDEAMTLLEYVSRQGDWRFWNHRRWFILAEERDQVVLVLVAKRRRVAQCHVSTAGTGASAAQTLADFQREVQRALGNQFGRFVQASQTINDQGYRVYRLVADGIAEEVPIRWIYYLLADRSGRQAVMSFLVEAARLEDFAAADQALAATFQFLPTEDSGENRPE